MSTVIPAGDALVTRVLYADAAIDPEPTGLTIAEVHSVPWREPLWAEGDQVRAAACAWVVQSAGSTIVIDPAGNIDEILHDPATTQLHQEGFLAAFDRAGIDVASVDAVVLSHIESVGITAVCDADRWRPFFPNSRLKMSVRALAAFDRSVTGDFVFEAFSALIERDLVDTFVDGDDVIPGVRAEWTGAHNPGHTAFHVGETLTFVGHLAVTPLHLATGPCPAQHREPDRAWAWLTDAVQSGRWLAGPLWPSPGALRFDGTTFVPWTATPPAT
jgi:glyoxylase-like metal-dependent hydrolase (beta-lactamase superfamily II)